MDGAFLASARRRGGKALSSDNGLLESTCEVRMNGEDSIVRSPSPEKPATGRSSNSFTSLWTAAASAIKGTAELGSRNITQAFKPSAAASLRRSVSVKGLPASSQPPPVPPKASTPLLDVSNSHNSSEPTAVIIERKMNRSSSSTAFTAYTRGAFREPGRDLEQTPEAPDLDDFKTKASAFSGLAVGSVTVLRNAMSVPLEATTGLLRRRKDKQDKQD